MPAPVPDPPHADTTNAYTGPSVKEMLATHSLTNEIIARHNDPCPILGPSELILLHRYVDNPSQRLEILRGVGMLDAEGEAPGSSARRDHGSLVGYTLANDYFREEDVSELKKWFDEGHADQRMKKGGLASLVAGSSVNE